MKCRYCGAEMRDDSVLCVTCGRLTPEFERNYRRPDPSVGRRRADVSRGYDPTVRSSAEPTPTKNPRKLLLLVIGAIAALAVLSLVLGFMMPQSAVEEYRETVDGQSVPEAYPELLDVYFEAVSDDDAATIRALRPEAVQDDDLADFDALHARYGDEIEQYEILSRSLFDPTETAMVEYRLGEEVELYDDVIVRVQFTGEEEPVDIHVGIVVIDSYVYLYEVQFSNSVI